jgi:maltose O-acetyltransferase
MNLKNYIKKKIIFFGAKVYWYFRKASQYQFYDDYRKKYNIPSSFYFNGLDTIFYGDGEIIIGENSYIGRNSTIQSEKNHKVVIGKNCKIGPFFSIWTHTSNVDHDYNFEDSITSRVGNVIIGDAVWIGTNVIISPGVTIGENSIIGANSVVTKDVPVKAIVGGVPSRIIRFKNIVD